MSKPLKTTESKSESKNSSKEDVYSGTSTRPGFAGQFEAFLRKYRGFAQFITMTPLGLMYCFCLGLALSPAFFILRWNVNHLETFSWYAQIPIVGFSLGISFVSFVITLITIVPIFNYPILPFVKPNRGNAFSLESIAWMYHNAFTYMVRYTVLEFITPTPLALWYFRRMGMKIGKGVIFNTANVSDPCLITIEDYVTIGGSAHLMAHYGMKGYLIIAPVIIRKGATIGLKASIMGDVEIGEGATVKPHTAVLPKTRLAAGEVL